MSLVVDEHRQYLADGVRVSAFRDALSKVVREGDVVLDLGAGTGILGLLACRAGARRVYSVDDGPIVGLARQISSANGFGDRIVTIRGFSTRIDLPEKVDVIVADQIGRFGFEAGIIEYFRDARARFLKPDGCTIPASIELFGAPIESRELFDQIEFWGRSPAGFNFEPARTMAVNTGYPAKFSPEHLLAEPIRLATIDLASASRVPLRAEGRAAIRRGGTLHGFGGWFAALLAPGITMTNSPLSPSPIDRRAVFFPLDQPVAVDAGDVLWVSLRIVPDEGIISWDVQVLGSVPGASAKAAFHHSTFEGMLLSREDLRRSRPDFVPSLTAWGKARGSVLELCDGRRTLSDIEEELMKRHESLFRVRAEAAGFVAEVLSRYAQ